MDKITLTATPPLGGFTAEIGGNRIDERTNAIVSIAIPIGGETALSDALKKGWSIEMPGPTLSTVSGETRAIRTAPDQMLLIFSHDASDANAVVKAKLGEAGYTTDQTDVWVQLEVSGAGTLAALERICPIDLDAAAFPIDATARTICEHMGTIITRLGDDRFLLMSAASSAASFLHAVETSFQYTTEI